ncbi:hypothetical protein, partial [Acinetobacter baumannii]|uniref:hypothetical protein n=2 Tax=Acinetobacter baumannii TaxID=470 RepID=UPI001AE6B899
NRAFSNRGYLDFFIFYSNLKKMNLAIGLSNFYHSMSTQIDGLDFFRFCLIEIVRKTSAIC